MAAAHWIICTNWTKVRRFTKKADNKNKFSEYMFIDSEIVTGLYGDKPLLMKTRREENIENAYKEW